MLCSAPTGKSGGSNWLDRLRSAKGFPAGEDGDDLERFLSGNPESTSPPQIPISESTQPPENRRREPGWGAGAVTNVLSELFFIGGSAENTELSGKKFPRKQTNPRLCVASNNGGGNSNSSVRADQIKENKKRKMKMKMKKKKKKRKSSDFAAKSPATVNSDCNSLTKISKRIDNMKEEEEDEDGEEDEEGEKELRGYSRTEATVIDTSFADWKVERVMFRKKNVWKVMEKRGKPKIFGRKKRKHDDEPKRPWLGNGDQSVKRPSLDEVSD